MTYAASLGNHAEAVEEALETYKKDNITARIWDGDHTVWQSEPDEISNRLGWLTIADRMDLDTINDLVEAVHSAGYTDILLLGMGGSSLAPEVFSRTFGSAEGHPDLHVLDSTDPGAVRAYDETLDLANTLFIVASKSGGTAETLSFFKYFYNRCVDELGEAEAGEHFIAITDPGSKLEKLGKELEFRHVFLNDPNIGGRYSALSFFGLVPAALLGINVPKLLERANAAAEAAKAASSDAAKLGVTIGELANQGRDKLTLITDPQIESFGDWVEQLIAESTGKAGKGILPVVGEDLGEPEVYGDDRVFVLMQIGKTSDYAILLNGLESAGHPVITLPLDDTYDLGAMFFLWAMATAVAGWRLGIHPFNQPNVESAKVQARAMINEYTEKGELPAGEIIDPDPGALTRFLDSASPGDYVTLQAFITPNEAATTALHALRMAIRDNRKLATTMGYGPRYLHSTGQLHKGDGGSGLFVQFTSEVEDDVDIPDEAGSSESAMTFGVLRDAQALGDAQALRGEGRRILRFRLSEDVLEDLAGLSAGSV
ncbi:MAG: glucose-6-phosphate isomerase [Anaerolineae bacterium]